MTTRRNFLKNTSILASSLFLSPSLSNAFLAKKQNIGIQLYTLRDILPKDIKGTLESIAKAGYTEVETYGFNSAGNFWGMPTAEFKNVLDANGLKAVSGHFDVGSFLTNGNTKDLKACIDASRLLGGKYVTIPGLAAAIRKDADAYKKIADKFNIAGEVCKDNGLKLAYHNHDFEFKKLDNNAIGYEILLKNTDKNLVDFELDLYWAVRSGNDPIKLFKENPGRFTCWHVKDMDSNKAEWNTEIGSGAINFKSIFKEAKLSGMKHFFVEQETNYKPDILGSINTSANYIKRNLLK